MIINHQTSHLTPQQIQKLFKTKNLKDIHWTTCKNCNTVIRGIRFKCLICPHFSLCQDCFYSKKLKQNHLTNHPMLPLRSFDQKINYQKLQKFFNNLDQLQKFLQSKVNHDDSCFCCYSNIIGLRIKCSDCSDMDLCYQCYKNQVKYKHPHQKDHSVLIFLEKVNYQIEQNKIDVFQKIQGQGFFGSVKKGKMKLSQIDIALKVVDAPKQILDYNQAQYTNIGKRNKITWENQRRAYCQFYSEHILLCYGFWRKKITNILTRFYIVLQWIENGTLESYIKKTKKEQDSKRRIFNFMYDVIKGLVLIHRKGFIHKDIKPDNIMITKNLKAKIGDFGIAIPIKQSILNQNRLAPVQYAAPEIFKQKNYDYKVDMYSFGLTMYFAFQKRKHKLIRGKQIFKVDFPEKPYFFEELILNLTNIDPKMRFSSQKVLQMMKQFDQIYWKTILKQRSMKSYVCLSNSQKNIIFQKQYPKIWKQVWEKYKK